MSSESPALRSPIKLYLLLALCLAPVAASYFVYYFWTPQKYGNYGELIEPRPLPDVRLQATDGKGFSLQALRGKWVLAMVESGNCDAGCRRELFTLRQLRLAQGKEMERVERVWLIDDGKAPDPGLVRDFPGTAIAFVSRDDLVRLFPVPGAPRDHIYLIDPLGNLMMRFPKDPEPGRVIKDMTRLLKVSRVG